MLHYIYIHYFPIAFVRTFKLYVMFYEYGDDTDDDNDDNSDDSGNNDKNYILTIISIFHAYLNSLHVVMCCFFFFCLYLVLPTNKPPILQIYNQCQTYPRSITQPCLSIYSSIPNVQYSNYYIFYSYSSQTRYMFVTVNDKE